MAEQKEKKPQGGMLYMPLGMSIGLSLGLAIGSAMGNIPIGMCMGLGIGLCFGSALDMAKQREAEKQAAEPPEGEEKQDA